MSTPFSPAATPIDLVPASRSGLSLNKTVISILEEGLGLSGGERPRVRHDNLDKFSGIWSDEEANEFDRLLAEQRRIDPEMWE